MRLTSSEIETIRIHMNAFKEKLCNQGRWNEAQEYQDIVDKLAELLTAESVTLCKDCKAYNGMKCVRNNMIAVRADDFCSRAERKYE